MKSTGSSFSTKFDFSLNTVFGAYLFLIMYHANVDYVGHTNGSLKLTNCTVKKIFIILFKSAQLVKFLLVLI